MLQIMEDANHQNIAYFILPFFLHGGAFIKGVWQHLILAFKKPGCANMSFLEQILTLVAKEPNATSLMYFEKKLQVLLKDISCFGSPQPTALSKMNITKHIPNIAERRTDM